MVFYIKLIHFVCATNEYYDFFYYRCLFNTLMYEISFSNSNSKLSNYEKVLFEITIFFIKIQNPLKMKIYDIIYLNYIKAEKILKCSYYSTEMYL